MGNALIVLFGLTMIYMAATSRIKAYINALAVQGFLLFLICYFSIERTHFLNFVFLSAETFFVKMLLIPLFLKKIFKRSEIYRDSEPYIPNFYSLITASLILFSGFILSNVLGHLFHDVTAIYFGVSISTIIISLFFITTRKKILTGVIGYIMMENGIFLLSLSVEKEMSIIVNMGVLLDIFIAVFILGLLVRRIGIVFEESNLSSLSGLKDSPNEN